MRKVEYSKQKARKEMGFMNSVYQARRDDRVIRMCAAGEGRWVTLLRSGATKAQIKRLIQERAISRAGRGFYLACCPNCHEPFMNVMGAEH